MGSIGDLPAEQLFLYFDRRHQLTASNPASVFRKSLCGGGYRSGMQQHIENPGSENPGSFENLFENQGQPLAG